MATSTINGTGCSPKKIRQRRQKEFSTLSSGDKVDPASSKHSTLTLGSEPGPGTGLGSPGPGWVRNGSGGRSESPGGNADSPTAARPPPPRGLHGGLKRDGGCSATKIRQTTQLETDIVMSNALFDVSLQKTGSPEADTPSPEGVSPKDVNGRNRRQGFPPSTKLKGDGNAHFQLNRASSSQLCGGEKHRKAVGTIQEVTIMARAARIELTTFAVAELPKTMTYMETLMFGMLIFNFRKPVEVLLRTFPIIDRAANLSM